MNFYTNVQLIGNQFLVRGYENGKYVMKREEWKPTLFVPSKRKSEYRTLEGEYVEAIQPGFVRDCREFYDKYKEVENFRIYGNERYVYQYISDNYPQEHLEFDIRKIKLYTIDIETKSEEGFPDVESANEEVLLITLQDFNTKQITTWGVGPFNNKQDNVNYLQFADEHSMLSAFINWWMEYTPDVVTGWNC